MTQLDDFTTAYIECALWSGSDDQDVPLDQNYSLSDFAPETLATIQMDCRRFQTENYDTIHDSTCSRGSSYVRRSGDQDKQAGHDFWLTRNGHGAGFLDGDWSEPAATLLTKASEQFGEIDLYVGDDGRLYV